MTNTTTDQIRWTAGVHRTQLPNGLTVLIERNDSAPVIASVAHVRAGYFDEPDEWAGIAHVLEHMYFKGTTTRGPGELARETQLVGGYVNAGTIYDKTIYYTVLPSEPGALERVVELQSDGLMHSRLDPGELASELEVIVQEARRKLDTPTAVTTETLYELLFAQHRIRRWRIGTEESLKRLTAEDVRAYYETRYVPARTIVAVVGPVDVEETLELVAARYGAWTDRRVEIAGSPPETDPPDPSRRVLRGDVQRPQVAVGWRTIGVLHEDAVALDVAAQVLGTGRGSWLHRGLRQPGLASSARVHHYTPGEIGVFDLTLEGPDDRVDEALGVALGAVQRLARVGPSAEDIVRVRGLMATQWARRMEGMDGRAAMFSEFEALEGLTRLDETYDRLLQVGPRDVQRVAAEYLDVAGASCVMYLGPQHEIVATDEAWPPPPRDLEMPEVIPGAARSGGTGRLAGGQPVGQTLVAQGDGVDVLTRAKRGSGLVNVSLLAPRLRDTESRETAGVSMLFARTALRGAGGLDGEQLAAAAERLGGSVAPSVLVGGVGWSITVRADAVTEAAELLTLIASDATLSDDAIVRERTLQVSDARRADDDMFNYPVRRVLELAMPDVSYGLPALGTVDTLESLTPSTVRAWARMFGERRLVVVAVGDAESSQIAAELGGLAGWAGRVAWDTSFGAPRWHGGCGEQERDKAQTALAMAFPAAPRGSSDRYAMLVLGALLSGLGGRLFEELREKRSLAYTVAAQPWQRPDAGAFLTYIATSPEREAEARDAMMAELRAVATAPFAVGELDRARRYVAGAFQIRQQRAASVAGEIYEAWNARDATPPEEVVNRLRAVTENEVRQVGERMFEADRAEFVLRGSEAPPRLAVG